MRQASTAIQAWRDPELQDRKEKLTDAIFRLLATSGRDWTLCEIADAVHRQPSSVTSTLAALKERGLAHIVAGAERTCLCPQCCTKQKQVWRSGPAPSSQLGLFA